MEKLISRRTFVGGAIATIAFPCWPRQMALGEVNAEDLRIAFFTDIHARRTAEVKAALEFAAKRINQLQADIVIAGGDLIFDGLEATSTEAKPSWDLYRQFHSELKGEVHVAVGNHDLVGVRPRDGSAPNKEPRAQFSRILSDSQDVSLF